MSKERESPTSPGRVPAADSASDAVRGTERPNVLESAADEMQTGSQLDSPKATPRLVTGLTRYDLSFLALVAIALMVLCVFSGSGTPLFLIAIGAGAGLAVVWMRFRKSRHPSLRDDSPNR